MEFALFYLDSVSRKIFFEMFVELKKALMEIKNITISWYYDDDDESIYELGSVLSNVLGIPFKFIEQE